MTVKDILIKYALMKREFTQTEMQSDLPRYGCVMTGKTHNPDTYNRKWRELRAEGGIPGYTITSEYKGDQKCFRVQPISK